MDKLTERLEYMLNFENDNYFVDVDVNATVENILYNYQLLHLYNLITSFRSNNVIMDGSDTGTGKTFTSIALCKQLNLRPIILCPKIIMGEWERVCGIFGVTPLCIINYEKAKIVSNNKYDIGNYVKVIKKSNSNDFMWNVPNNGIIIFDEVHRCKNKNTLNYKLLLAAKKMKHVLMLSATLTDKHNDFGIFGYMLGLYNNINKGNAWINAKLYEDSVNVNKTKLSAICASIYPSKGSRMQVSELQDKFPQNKVVANAYSIGDEEIKQINEYVKNVKDNKYSKNGDYLVLHNKLRQHIELIKVGIMKDLIMDHLDEGFNIVVFLNYTESINKLAELCNTKCIVNGETSDDDRKKNIDDFQNGRSKLIICNISIESINLHDVNGVGRRLSLISPNFSSSQLIQALGRIYRVGSQSACMQKIIFCKDTYEETICNRIKDKLEFVEKLNSNELIEIENL